MPVSLFSHNLTRSFGILLALLLFLVGFSMFNFHALSQANTLNIHTYQVISETLKMETTVSAMDSGARGFIVAGDRSALDAYYFHSRIFEKRLLALRRLTSDNPIQKRNLAELNARKQQWIVGLIEPSIAAARRQIATDPRQVFVFASRSTLKHRSAVIHLLQMTDRVRSVEEQLLMTRSEEQRYLKWRTEATLLVGAAFSVLLTAFLALFASRGARQLSRSNALLSDAITRAENANTRLRQTNAQMENEISARQAADEKLRRSVLELRRSNAELEQFAYVASHDLQEPLRAVGGCVQVLQRRYGGKLDARADQFIQHAVDGAQRMQTLIHDLLSYSRLGSEGANFRSVEGAAIVQAALQSVSVAATESGAQITVDAMPVLSCEARQIEQVLQNLLSNALKFRGQTPPRVHIGYATRTENGTKFHLLSVEDDGPGIEPQYFERIFVMFQRLHTRAAYSGTGIGLAICKKVVERHGGQIWVESWTGSTAREGARHGSKFTFSLPCEPDTGENRAVSEEQVSGVETASENPAASPQTSP